MHWSDWSVGGGLGRAQVLGTDVDLMAATLGYGRVTRARSPWASRSRRGGAPQDVLMLSTDLAAWSWLTLESDLAVGSPSAASMATATATATRWPPARFGLRLNF